MSLIDECDALALQHLDVSLFRLDEESVAVGYVFVLGVFQVSRFIHQDGY